MGNGLGERYFCEALTGYEGSARGERETERERERECERARERQTGQCRWALRPEGLLKGSP